MKGLARSRIKCSVHMDPVRQSLYCLHKYPVLFTQLVYGTVRKGSVHYTGSCANRSSDRRMLIRILATSSSMVSRISTLWLHWYLLITGLTSMGYIVNLIGSEMGRWSNGTLRVTC